MKQGSKIALLAAAGVAALLLKKKQPVSGVGAAKKTRRIGTVEMTHPAVYVGTYAKYNNGSLFGEWVDLTKFDTYEAFMRYIRNLHKDERDPEFMMQDFEGYPESWYYESGMDKATFNKIKEYWNAFDGDDVKKQAYEAYAADLGDKATVEDFEQRYNGTYDSEYDYVDEMIEQGVINPDAWAKKYGTWVYDHEAIWRYLDTDGSVKSYRTDYGDAIIYPGVW